jgi:hypothetical protein
VKNEAVIVTAMKKLDSRDAKIWYLNFRLLFFYRSIGLHSKMLTAKTTIKEGRPKNYGREKKQAEGR